LQFVERRKDLAAYFIYHREDGTVADTASSKFYKLIKR
jgi:thiamine biosynthesis lipoprotein